MQCWKQFSFFFSEGMWREDREHLEMDLVAGVEREELERNQLVGELLSCPYNELGV